MKILLLMIASLSPGAIVHGADLRIGIIGCDTSHAVAFTDILNNPEAKAHVGGGRVVAAFKGGSPDLPASASRVEKFAQDLRDKHGVVFYDTIEQLCANVDAVLLESVDGRVHLEQVRPVIAARKPVFIDKPMAASLADAREIFRLAETAKVPLWSASSLRYGNDTQAVRAGSIGRVTYAETYSPFQVERHHPDLFWYGIHGVESLFTVMGTGCETVQRRITPEGAVEVAGTWSGGRAGIFRADLQKKYHGIARGEKGEAPVGSYDGYAPLVVAIVEFFRTGVAPVQPAETIEIMVFMAAAQVSKETGGSVVRISDVMRADATVGTVDGAGAPNTLTDYERKAGWRLLWDGRTNAGWRSAKAETFPTTGWAIEDGTWNVPETGGGEARAAGDIITIERFADFELVVDFKNSPGGNTGIKYFVQPDIDPVTGAGTKAAVGSAIGPEFQIIDDDRHPEGATGRDSAHGFGALYELYPAAATKLAMPAGEWNTARIVCAGTHVEHWLNGQKIVEYERGSADFRARVAKSKFRTIPGFGEWADGHILLQDHGNAVSFRNIKIRTRAP